MAAVVKETVNLLLVANLTELHLVVGDQVLHAAAAVASAGPEPADVRVARLGVDEPALAVHGVVAPLARVLVRVVEPHPAVPAPLARHERARVHVAPARDVRALAVVEPVPDLARVGVAGEVAPRDLPVCGQAAVVAPFEQLEVGSAAGELAFLLELVAPAEISSCSCLVRAWER